MAGKISIITVTLNSDRYLEQTITSVVDQTYDNTEYIIVDGGSSDDTIDIIKKYESNIDHWISEPDKGIADAMNKGISLATGDYILFLHSDDYLLNSKMLEQAANHLHGIIDIYLFPVILDDRGQKKLSSNRRLGWYTNFKMGSCHQGQLCSRKFFEQIGKFDTKYKIVMDYDLILRGYRDGVRSCSINFPISVMRLAGISSRTDLRSLQDRFEEERQVHYANCTMPSMKLMYSLYWILYRPYRQILFWITR